MARYIDADAFDKYLEGAEIEATKNRKYVFSSAINTIRGNLANFPTVNQWIPCSERLPEEKKEVLVSADGDLYIAILETINGKSFWSEVIEYRYIMGVTAWMPLPEPWKEEEE